MKIDWMKQSLYGGCVQKTGEYIEKSIFNETSVWFQACFIIFCNDKDVMMSKGEYCFEVETI